MAVITLPVPMSGKGPTPPARFGLTTCQVPAALARL